MIRILKLIVGNFALLCGTYFYNISLVNEFLPG
jgi:hypothetical protein